VFSGNRLSLVNFYISIKPILGFEHEPSEEVFFLYIFVLIKKKKEQDKSKTRERLRMPRECGINIVI
jgi:hypothetical protein